MEVSEAPLANGLAGFSSLEPELTNGNSFTNGHADAPPDLGAQFASELPEVLNDLVPLSFIVERVVGQAYTELANLAEILPSTQDAARKRAIVDYVLQTRRQILKLLVLVRWSAEADNVGKCMNIVGFLGRQNFGFDQTISSLTEVKTMLAGARVRNYDLPTAISVLTTGTYTRLPSIITETFGADEKLSDQAVLKTLKQLDEVLRWRLSCVEALPQRMSRYWIADGRATFRVEGMWEASLTYGGDNDDADAQWYLLSLKFLFRVRDALGAWSSLPIGPMKEQIVNLCNQELARRPSAPEAEAATGEAAIEKEPQDTPIVRGYNFLQRLALSYQIEALYMQALQLSATAWAGHLRVDLSKDRKTLRVDYWTPATPKPQPQSRQASAQPTATSYPNFLSISSTPRTRGDSELEASGANSGGRSAARERGLEAARALGVGASPMSDAEDQLAIAWSSEGLPDELKASVKLELDTDLDLEALLLRTTSVHAREATLQLHRQLLADFDSEELELVEGDRVADRARLISDDSMSVEAVPSIRIHLYGQQFVLASINPASGRLELKAVGEVSTNWEARLRSAADKVDRDRKLAGETLMRVRAASILDEVESRAAYLGLQTTRRLPFRTQDLTKFGTPTRTYLFVMLPKLPWHYLVLVLAEEGFRFALISVREGSDTMQTWLYIDELGWLDKSSASGDWGAAMSPRDHEKPAPFGLEVSLEDLRDIYQYCVRRIAYFKIEQQLHIRRIPYQPVASISAPSTPIGSPSATAALSLPSPTSPSTSNRPHLLSETSPYLVIQSSDLLRSTARVAYPNIAVQCSLKDNTIRTTLHVRFRDLALVKPDPSDLPSSMTYNPKTSVITFTSDDLDTCVPTFLTAYSIVARSILLAQHHASQATKGEAAIGEEVVDDAMGGIP